MNIRKWTIVSLSLTCGLFLVGAQAAEAAGETKLYEYRLKNGMQLLVKPDRRAPTAVHMLWIRAGAMDEDVGVSGVAHVLEHMMFKGTPKVKAGEFSRQVAALGGRENAFTAQDYTAYFQQIPSDKLADVMKLEADRFANSQWADEEFVKEIEVVKEERRMRTEDNPRSILFEQLMAATFTSHPYHKPIVGWMPDLDNLKPNDVRDFYKKWYRPSNAAIVVAGDVEPIAVKAFADKYYAGITERKGVERKEIKEPEQTGLRRVEVKEVADQAYLLMAYKSPKLLNLDQPSASDWDAAALTVLSAVMDGHSGARLERNLIHSENPVANSASTASGSFARGPQVFYVEGVPAKGKSVADLRAALLAQIKKVADEGVSSVELKRVKTQFIASKVYQQDSVFYQARELGSRWALGLPQNTEDKLFQLIDQITSEQVQRVAKTYFLDDSLTEAVLLPQARDPNYQPRKPLAGMRH